MAAGNADEFMALVTRDGRNAMGFISNANANFVNLASLNGDTIRTFPIDETKCCLLQRPSWEFGVMPPKLPLGI